MNNDRTLILMGIIAIVSLCLFGIAYSFSPAAVEYEKQRTERSKNFFDSSDKSVNIEKIEKLEKKVEDLEKQIEEIKKNLKEKKDNK